MKISRSFQYFPLILLLFSLTAKQMAIAYTIDGEYYVESTNYNLPVGAPGPLYTTNASDHGMEPSIDEIFDVFGLPSGLGMASKVDYNFDLFYASSPQYLNQDNYPLDFKIAYFDADFYRGNPPPFGAGTFFETIYLPERGKDYNFTLDITDKYNNSINAGSNELVFRFYDFNWPNTGEAGYSYLTGPVSWPGNQLDIEFVDVPLQDISKEHVSEEFSTGAFGWNSNYDIAFTNQTVDIDLNIELVGDDPGNTLKQQWEEGIEKIWSNSYDIIDGIYGYPIVVNLDWVDTNPDQIVTVHTGSGRTDMLNWYTDKPGGWENEYQDEIAAHEAGHMMGLYDEYPGGALDPTTSFTTTNSIMADLGPTRDWHYESILNWLESKSNRDLYLAHSPLPPYEQDDRIPNFNDPSPGVPVPEPASIILISLGFAGFLILEKKMKVKQK